MDAVAVQAAVDETERILGPLDVVIPNAGVGGSRPFEYTPFDDWWKMMEVNVKGPMMLINMVLGGMKRRNAGSIIIIASRAGLMNIRKLNHVFAQLLGLNSACGEAGFSGYCVSK